MHTHLGYGTSLKIKPYYSINRGALDIPKTPSTVHLTIHNDYVRQETESLSSSKIIPQLVLYCRHIIPKKNALKMSHSCMYGNVSYVLSQNLLAQANWGCTALHVQVQRPTQFSMVRFTLVSVYQIIRVIADLAIGYSLFYVN